MRPICVETEYATAHAMVESTIGQELFVPCREPDVLSARPGATIWLSVTFADHPGQRFELTGVLLGVQRLPEPGFRFSFVAEPQLYRYLLERAPRYIDERTRRIDARLPVACWAGDLRVDAITYDVSRTGALIQTSLAFEPGTRVAVCFSNTVQLDAEVVRRVESAEVEGLAVQFSPTPAMDQLLAALG